MRNGSGDRPTLMQRLWGVWFAAVFTTLALLTAALVALLPGQERRRRLTGGMARWVFRLTGSWPDVSGAADLPGGAAVAVANHASYIDGILLTAVLPHRFHFVIKREVTRLPVAHFLLRRIGAHFVERFDVRRGASDARRIIQTAAQGGSLAFFPEGTFTAEPGLKRFRNGAFVIAARGAMPLVPVTLTGTRTMLPANRILPVPAQLRVVIHEAVAVSPDSDIAELMRICRERILSACEEPDLQPPDSGPDAFTLG